MKPGPQNTPPSIKLAWAPHEGPQAALVKCPADEIFYGGARGGGKTDGMLGKFAIKAGRYGKDCVGVFFRRSREDLKEAIERSREIYGPLGAKWHEQKKWWTFPNGARLKFEYLDRDADADNYQGHNYTDVFFEELTHWPDQKPVNKLRATLRSAAGVPCQFHATGNPGGPGHQWVKSRYIDPAPLGWELIWEDFENPFTKEVIRKNRVFIPSRLSDNPCLGSTYVANLYQSGSEQLVRAWLGGDWSVIEGAFFDCWSNEKHVLAPFAIPPDWLRFRSLDWGSAAPFSVGWWAVVGDDYDLAGRNHSVDAGASLVANSRRSPARVDSEPQSEDLHRRGEGGRSEGLGIYDGRGVLRTNAGGGILPRGALIRYREWYGASAPNVGLKLTAEEVAQGILERSLTDQVEPNKSPYAYTVADPSMFSQDGGPSLAERFVKAGLTGLRPADNARVSQKGAMGGWDMMRARMKGLDGVPMLYTFATCRDSIRTIPALQHDPDRPEDLDTDGEDHAADEWRYACMSRPWIPRKPVEQKPTELIYTAQSDGRIVANMSVMDWVRQQERKKARE